MGWPVAWIAVALQLPQRRLEADGPGRRSVKVVHFDGGQPCEYPRPASADSRPDNAPSGLLNARALARLPLPSMAFEPANACLGPGRLASCFSCLLPINTSRFCLAAPGLSATRRSQKIIQRTALQISRAAGGDESPAHWEQRIEALRRFMALGARLKSHGRAGRFQVIPEAANAVRCQPPDRGGQRPPPRSISAATVRPLPLAHGGRGDRPSFVSPAK